MRKLYLGTNTKMFKTASETVSYLRELDRYTADLSRDELELFVIPSYTALKGARECVPAERVTIGAQNMCWEERGQFTGEISPLMLSEAGVEIVEIGHSERRHTFHETDEEENRKVLCALRHGFRVLLCIGETGEEKAYGIADEVLRIQLKKGLYLMPEDRRNDLMIAYEPVWAIGVEGIPAAPDYVQRAHGTIRQTLCELFGDQGARIPILYGGSVNESNCESLIALDDVDGLFIGRSAWEASRFNRLIRKALSKCASHE